MSYAIDWLVWEYFFLDKAVQVNDTSYVWSLSKTIEIQRVSVGNLEM
jgi:hypothetical protein